jgi:hypothetical protein
MTRKGASQLGLQARREPLLLPLGTPPPEPLGTKKRGRFIRAWRSMMRKKLFGRSGLTHVCIGEADE